MNRYIQQKNISEKKKPERKIPLSKPNTYNQKIMENSKPLYTGRGEIKANG